MDRYEKNQNMLTQAECDLIHQKRVCVIGCGGLGGYVIEMLARLGVGEITLVDGDVFDVTNLNRQLLATEMNLGTSKVAAALARVKQINSDVRINALATFLDAENAERILTSHHVVVDALDDIAARFILQEAASNLGIPMVYGAIAGWYGQVSTILPGKDFLSKVYRTHDGKGHEQNLGNPSFTPALVASVQVSEVLKLLIGRGDLLVGKLMLIDLLENEVETAHLD